MCPYMPLCRSHRWKSVIADKAGQDEVEAARLCAHDIALLNKAHFVTHRRLCRTYTIFVITLQQLTAFF